ncbi:MAG: hypothetical protein H7A45_10030 [Verrucomicrobiales bacterium]|nr:hypothetical protein [Verrucomicrobiales bacterium]
MPLPDVEIIKAVLATVLNQSRDAEGPNESAPRNPRPGRLAAPPPVTYTTAEEAWQAFARNDGPGWLQNAHTQGILQGDDLSRQLADCKGPQWPVAGECVSADGRTSLHLRRAGGGWEITALAEEPSADGILLTRRLLSADLSRCLVYDIAHERVTVGGHEELRPVASRFVGFAPLAGVPTP